MQAHSICAFSPFSFPLFMHFIHMNLSMANGLVVGTGNSNS